MSHRHFRKAGGLRKQCGKGSCIAEKMEERRLLASVSFGTPISTALPQGFTPASLIATTGNNSDVFVNGYIVTDSAGGGLLLHANNDGTFNTVQTLSTSATILGATEIVSNNNPVPTVVTTSGLMTRQSNGTFNGPSGLSLPSDTVTGSPIWDPAGNQVIVERFHPNLVDTSKGAIILAAFRIGQNGLFGSEIDTTVLTNVPAPTSTHPLWNGDFNNDFNTDVIAGGLFCQGNGDGTFQIGSSLNLSNAEINAPGYTARLATGFSTFTGLVVFPAPVTTSDQNDAAEVAFNQIFGPQGGRVDLSAKGTTSGPLALADFNKDGATDMAVAVTSGSTAPAVVIAPGLGDGTFLNPVLVSVPSVQSVAGINASSGALLCFTATGPSGGPLTYSIASLPNNSSNGPYIQLSATPSTSFVNQAITLSGMETTSNSFTRGATMDFFDGATKVGTASIGQDGTATFTTSTLTAGVHTITALDETYGGNSTSAPITVTLNADPPHPLVSASSFDVKLPTVITPGDKGLLTVNLSNVGAEAGTAKLAIKLYATANGVVDSSAIPIPIQGLVSTSQSFAPKKGKAVKTTFNVPDNFPPGSYQWVLTLDAAQGSNASYVIPATLVHDSPVTVSWQFGVVGDRKNVKFVQHLSSGHVVTFSIIGAGTGTITEGPAGGLTLGGPDYTVAVTGTNVASKFAITQTGSTASNVLSLTFDNNVGSVDVSQDTPLSMGPVAAPVGGQQPTISVGKLSVGTLPVGQVAPGSSGPTPSTTANITINGNVSQLSAANIGSGKLAIGTTGAAGQIAVAKIGKIQNTGVFNSAVPIATLQMGSTEQGSLVTAPSIGKLTTTGDFNSNLFLTQPTAGAAVLGFVQIGGSINAATVGDVRWAVNGNIGKVQINGSVKNFQLLGGAKVGPAGQLTTPPAAYSGTSIFSITIRGSVTTSLLAAGLDPVDGVLGNSDDKLLPGGSIGAISVTGNVSTDSHFEAASLPDFVIVGNKKTATSGDPRFKSS